MDRKIQENLRARFLQLYKIDIRTKINPDQVVKLCIPGDIILYRSPNMPTLNHVDICINHNESRGANFDGVSDRKISSQIKSLSCVSCVVYRSKIIGGPSISAAIKKKEGDYDFAGYYGQWGDFFAGLLLGENSDFLTAVMQNPGQYYCSELVAETCDEKGWRVSGKPYSLTAPHDIYNYCRQDKNTRLVYVSGLPQIYNPDAGWR